MLVIKRYPNRKLYNTRTKQYISLEGVADLVRKGIDVQVIDHASGEDLTTLTLTQIILEYEKTRSGLLPHAELTSLIRMGSDWLIHMQHSLFSLRFWRQIDEEIKRRIQVLVNQGELNAADGQNLLEKLLLQGQALREKISAWSDNFYIPQKELEEALGRLQIPTHEDLQKLNEQLEELSVKLDSLT